MNEPELLDRLTALDVADINTDNPELLLARPADTTGGD